MKRVCAWCNQEMDDVDRPGNRPVTHGLCPACRRRFFPSAKGKETDPLLAIPSEVGKEAERPREPIKA